MKYTVFFSFFVLSTLTFSQKENKLNLTNALIVGQMDKEDERFMLEIGLTEFFADRGINAVPSLNVLKQGTDATFLATPEMKSQLLQKGVDTYMLVSVRGYDSRFKETEKRDNLTTALEYGTLFSLFRDEVTSVTFEFFIFRNDEMVKTALIRCSNISSKETVLKRLKKRLARKMKRW